MEYTITAAFLSAVVAGSFVSKKRGTIMPRFLLSAAVASAIVVYLLEPTFAMPGMAVIARGTDEPANRVHWYNYRAVSCNLRVPCPLRHVHHRPDVFYGEYWRPGRPIVSCNLRVPCPYGYP
jgi:hypothetical protein